MDAGKDPHLGAPWPHVDSRSPSMQSLHSPGTAIAQEKRKLLLIYVHGFLGDETSFKQFPAHVHHCLTDALKERVIHTKVYPKYKTRQKMEQVREIFSDWLAPHESPDQDIILLGHSMGGILAAEVALLPSRDLGNMPRHRHRILGTINFDVPFLGMHPGIVGSGIGSLFRPAPKPERSPSPARLSTTTSTQSTLAECDSSTDLHPSDSHASSTSHLSRPSAYPSASASQISVSLSIPVNDPNYDPKFSNDVVLKKRKGRSNFWHFMNKHSNDLLHAAETWVTSHAEFGGAMADYKSLKRRYDAIRSLEDRGDTLRVRFVNYYTACHGRPKVIKETATAREGESMSIDLDRDLADVHIGDQERRANHPASEYLTPTAEEREFLKGSTTKAPSVDPPDIPSEQRLERLASKTNQSNAIAATMIPKEESEGSKQTDLELSGSQLESPEVKELVLDTQDKGANRDSKAAKPKKDKKFCFLPRKHGGVRDPCWIKVFMPNVDEVGAHCGLFSMEEDPDRYELFVQDVSMRLVDWINEYHH